MKKIWIVVILTALFSTFLNAQTSPQIKFDDANEVLEKGEYRKALKTYREIEESGSVSGALYLNMGIAAVQVDSLGLAKFYFIKASQFDEVATNAYKALEFVNSQFSRQSAKLPKLPWDKAVDILKVKPGIFGIFLIGFLFLITAISLIITRWFDILTLPKHTNFVITSGIISLLIITLSFYVEYVDNRYSEAVLILNEANVMERADDEASLVSKAYEGYEVTIDFKKSEEKTDWYYIRLGNGQYGWIKTEGIKTL